MRSAEQVKALLDMFQADLISVRATRKSKKRDMLIRRLEKQVYDLKGELQIVSIKV